MSRHNKSKAQEAKDGETYIGILKDKNWLKRPKNTNRLLITYRISAKRARIRTREILKPVFRRLTENDVLSITNPKGILYKNYIPKKKKEYEDTMIDNDKRDKLFRAIQSDIMKSISYHIVGTRKTVIEYDCLVESIRNVKSLEAVNKILSKRVKEEIIKVEWNGKRINY